MKLIYPLRKICNKKWVQYKQQTDCMNIEWIESKTTTSGLQQKPLLFFLTSLSNINKSSISIRQFTSSTLSCFGVLWAMLKFSPTFAKDFIIEIGQIQTWKGPKLSLNSAKTEAYKRNIYIYMRIKKKLHKKTWEFRFRLIYYVNCLNEMLILWMNWN